MREYKIVKKLSALVFCTALLCQSSTAYALSFIQLGTIEETQSWRLPATIFESAGFDAIEGFIVSNGGGGPFESPGFNLFSDASWSGTLVNPTYTAATGNSVISLDFSLNFDGDLEDPTQTDSRASAPLPVAFDLLLYQGGLGGTLVGGFRLTYNGDNTPEFSLVPSGTVYDRAEPSAPPVDTAGVPETGSTLGLLGLGVVGLGWLRRKLRLS